MALAGHPSEEVGGRERPSEWDSPTLGSGGGRQARLCAASRARFASAGSRRLAADVAYLDQVAGRLAATMNLPPARSD